MVVLLPTLRQTRKGEHMKTTIELAREAGAIHIHERPKEFAIVGNDSIKAFEALVRADQRAIDAGLCKDVIELYRGTAMGKHAELVGDDCAGAILYT
jgi:hypothetical protein